MKHVVLKSDGDNLFETSSASGYALKVCSRAQEEAGACGAKPTEMVLMALAGCFRLTLAALLPKMRIDARVVEVAATAQEVEKPPRVLTEVELVCRLQGKLEGANLELALEKAEKYCPVSQMLKDRVKITVRAEALKSAAA